MKLEFLDIAIIFGYLALTVLVGFYLSSRASKNLRAYFLGGNNIPWYILGFSNASGMFDISGTMWTVSICFIYGLKSAWIPWIWPVWNQIFIMIFLAIWMRRSNVMTGAEWMKTRFGTGRGAELAQIVVVIFAIFSVIGFIAYGFEGLGKFAVSFFPYDLSFGLAGITIDSPDAYALIIIGITTVYVIKGGMFSVIGTEVLQFLIMTIACFAIGYIAFNAVTTEQINQAIPDGWKSLWFGWELDLDWSGLIDSVNTRIDTDGFSLFGFALMMMVFKGIFSSLAGPVPSYDMQRILATRSPKEAAKMSGLTPFVLYFPRYLMVGGLTVIALVHFTPYIQSMGTDIDFEIILPLTLSEFVPAGLLGLILAGLLAAFMSTFAAFVNAAPAYIVNDIYKKYINPTGSDKRFVYMSYLASFVVVLVGVGFGFLIESIDSITKWLVAALYGGYAAPNVLKWIWWRFNGFGYFWGMIAGLVGSMTAPFIFPDLPTLYAFPYIFALALAGSIIGSLMTPPDEEAVLIDFYKTVRPWGFWKPVKVKAMALYPDFRPNSQFRRDAFNVVIGVAWQMCMVVVPLYLMIREYWAMGVGTAIFFACTWILKKNWWDKLPDD